MIRRGCDIWAYNMVILGGNGEEITATGSLDSGASTNVISDEMATELGLDKIPYDGEPYKTLTGELIQPESTVKVL